MKGYDEPVIRVGIKNDYTGYFLEEFTSMILEKLKDMAENHLNTTVKYAIITVPYEFDEQQRNATRNAAELARLNVLHLVDEPTVIGFAYRLDTTYCDGKGEKVDCRYIIYEHDGRAPHLTLLKIGKGGFGVLGTVLDDHGNEPTSSFWASLFGQVPLKESGPPAAELQSERIPELVDRLLLISNKDKKDVDGLIVITSDPALTSNVQETLEACLPGKKAVKPFDFTPDQAIVCGASIQADALNSGVMVNLIDVAFLSLGIETSNGSFLRIIHRNTPSPTRKSVVVYTTADHQRNILLPIYEGEREIASHNHHLGDIAIDVSGLGEKAKAKEEVKIELSFELSPYEILNVTATVGGVDIQEFVGLVEGRRYKWRDAVEVVREAEEWREEDLRVLGEGGIVGAGGVEVEEGG